LETIPLGGENKMSKKYFHTLIIENDPFASDMMMLLLARDYRTHVVGELSTRGDLSVFDSLLNLREAKKLNKKDAEFDYFDIDPKQPVDVIILGTEVPQDVDLPIKVMEKFSKWIKPPKILCTCTYPDIKMLQKLSRYGCFSGYLVKSDVLYSIASAVCLAANGYSVITPRVCPLLEKGDLQKFPGETLIISSHNDGKKIRKSEKMKVDILRLNLIFNLPIYDIHDELSATEKYIAQVISKGYSNLQISDIVSGTITLNELFANPYIDNEKIIDHYQKIINDLPKIMKRRKEDKKRSPKFRNMSTLAFHLLTRPDIKKW
jgi:DNA-binding NarL/FixJ family response regulator